MSEKTVCDQCRKRVHWGAATLQFCDLHLIQFGDASKDFCSWLCLARFAMARHKQRSWIWQVIPRKWFGLTALEGQDKQWSDNDGS